MNTITKQAIVLNYCIKFFARDDIKIEELNISDPLSNWKELTNKEYTEYKIRVYKNTRGTVFIRLITNDVRFYKVNYGN